ncbi:MAG: hypothetical protein ACLQU5_10270 [Isosphaeraceae bacterium]
MAAETRRAKRQHAGIAILDQLADLDVRSISPETAQTLLKLRFDEFHHERFNLLTAKAREASLTPAEQAELDEYIQTADILAIVQSKARQALKSAGVAAQ